MNQTNSVRSVEFYQMFVQNHFGKLQPYYGAVLFGPRHNSGCEVLRILLPMSTLAELYGALSKIHSSRLQQRLIFLEWEKDDLMAALQAFCQQGHPLPNLFEGNLARLEGLTVFQLACYRQACAIPHGETKSYSWLTERLKKFGAERAVGGAMRSNPFPLLIPCHRIIKKDGSLGGFMGAINSASWQINLKKTLLEIEGLHQQPSLFSSMPSDSVRLVV